MPSNKPITSPSDIRLDNLNASLNAFDTWRNFQPLTLGVEKQVFQHIAKHQLSCSKRVVQRLLRAHVKDPKYLQATIGGLMRLNLDGTEAEVILQSEKDYAIQLNSVSR
jgi:sRNA-binding protein